MQKRLLNGRSILQRSKSATLSALILLCLALTAACAAPAAVERLAPVPADTPAPADTSAPAPIATPALSLRVVQTVYNEYTQRRRESVFDECISIGKHYTVETDSGAWSLTFTITELADGTATIETDRMMHPVGSKDARADTFTIPFDSSFRIDEPLKNIAVWYTFTFYDPLAATPLPEGAVLFTNRFILSNIRRTLHESSKSAFTQDELFLILFVELKNPAVEDIAELAYLYNMETLLLRNTHVTDLTPLSDSNALRTLILDGNKLLDYETMPALPNLRTLSISGECPEETLLLLQTRLPDCTIITE